LQNLVSVPTGTYSWHLTDFFWNFFQTPPEFFKKMLAEFFQKFFPDLFGKNFEKPEENFFHIFRKILLLPLEAGKRPCLPLTS